MFRKIVALAAFAAGGVMLSKHLRKSHESKMESTVEESVEIDVPVGTHTINRHGKEPDQEHLLIRPSKPSVSVLADCVK